MTEPEIRKRLSGYKGNQSILEVSIIALLDTKDAEIRRLTALLDLSMNHTKAHIELIDVALGEKS